MSKRSKIEPEEPELTEEEEFLEEYMFSVNMSPGGLLPDGWCVPEMYGGVWYSPEDLGETKVEEEISIDKATSEEWNEFLKKLEDK